MIDIAIILALASALGTSIHALINYLSSKNDKLMNIINEGCQVVFTKNHTYIYKDFPTSNSFIDEVKIDNLIEQVRKYINERTNILCCTGKYNINTRIRERILYLNELEKISFPQSVKTE